MAALPGFQVEAVGRRLGDFLNIGPRGSHLHPFDERLDLGIRQGAGGRHQRGPALDAVDQGALLRLACNHGRSRDASLDQVLAPVQAQPGKWRRRLGAVAFVAVVGQQGADLFFEEFQGGGIRRRGQSGGQADEERGTCAQAWRETLHDRCRNGGQGCPPSCQARIPWITCPWTSVRRKSRPPKR